MDKINDKPIEAKENPEETIKKLEEDKNNLIIISQRATEENRVLKAALKAVVNLL